MISVHVILNAQAQRTITGTVVHASDNLGIPGISVVEKGTMNGAITGADGMYAIQVSQDATHLVY